MAVFGVTAMLVNVWFTPADLVLLTERPQASTIFTMKPYEPAMEKVAVEKCDALAPLLLKVTVAPDGAEVTDQV